MAGITKTAIERAGKAIEMEKIIGALTSAGIEVDRVVDNGTLAYMIKDGTLEGRFITIKVVLTKEYNEEKLSGFEITDAIAQYEEKIRLEAERAAKAAAKSKKTEKVETPAAE